MGQTCAPENCLPEFCQPEQRGKLVEKITASATSVRESARTQFPGEWLVEEANEDDSSPQVIQDAEPVLPPYSQGPVTGSLCWNALTFTLVVVYVLLSMWGRSLQFGRIDAGEMLADIQFYLSCVFGLDVLVALIHSVTTPSANFFTSIGDMFETLIAILTILDNFNVRIPAPALFLAQPLAQFTRILPCCDSVRNPDDVLEDRREIASAQSTSMVCIKQAWEFVMVLVTLAYTSISFYRYWITEDWEAAEFSGAKNMAMVVIVSFLVLSVLISALESCLSQVRNFCDDSKNLFQALAALISFSTQVGLWLPVSICRLAKPIMKLLGSTCCQSNSQLVDQPISQRTLLQPPQREIRRESVPQKLLAEDDIEAPATWWPFGKAPNHDDLWEGAL